MLRSHLGTIGGPKIINCLCGTSKHHHSLQVFFSYLEASYEQYRTKTEITLPSKFI